jgi:hypothetical protein
MGLTREQVVKQVHELVSQGVELLQHEVASRAKKTKSSHPKGDSSSKDEHLPFVVEYQSWYTKALPIVKLVLPDRYLEFIEQYKLEKRKEITFLTYAISDYLIGLRITRGTENVVDVDAAFASKFQHQIFILRSAADRLQSAFSEIEGTLRAEMFDGELSAAEELRKKGHLRAAGALAGVTLERHLGVVANSHQVRVGKTKPTIADYNEALKRENVLDIPMWRSLQHLADLRNYAVHDKGREPTAEEMDDLVRGVQRALKTLF